MPRTKAPATREAVTVRMRIPLLNRLRAQRLRQRDALRPADLTDEQADRAVTLTDTMERALDIGLAVIERGGS